MTNFLETNRLLHDSQYGFRKGKSCEDAAIQIVKFVTEKLEEKELCAAIFCDISKAFDTIDHQRLLQKLERIGIGGPALKLLTSYLNERKQIFRFENNYSDPQFVTCGVPQGSVLGPLLFIIYMNDIFEIREPSHILSFADDTAILVRAKNLDDLIEKIAESAKCIEKWMYINGLALNISKTKYIIFGEKKKNNAKNVVVHSQQCIPNMCTCKTLERVTSYKYLGLYIDESLKFKIHIDKVLQKVRSGVAILSNLSRVAPTQIKKAVYFSLIESHLRYMICVYGGAAKTDLKPLETLQKRAIRYVYSCHRLTHTRMLFQNLNALELVKLYAYCLIGTMYVKTNTLLRPTHKYSTRSKTEDKLITAKFQRNTGRNSTTPTFIRLFNASPDKIRQLISNPFVVSKSHLLRIYKEHLFGVSLEEIRSNLS